MNPFFMNSYMFGFGYNPPSTYESAIPENNHKYNYKQNHKRKYNRKKRHGKFKFIRRGKSRIKKNCLKLHKEILDLIIW